MPWQCHVATDAGKVRKVNEDSVYHSDTHQLWAVADGMGGHHRGDIASQTIVKYLQSFDLAPHAGITVQRIRSILQAANTELLEKARSEGSGIIATTCAILLRVKDTAVCIWVGDSRIYRYRTARLTSLTRDHSYESLIEDMRNSGEQVQDIMVNTQTLTRGIGAEGDLQIEMTHFPVNHGDRFLLCTDGLYKEVSEQEILKHYGEIGDDATLLSTLHQGYLDGGARDNLGIILVTAS